MRILIQILKRSVPLISMENTLGCHGIQDICIIVCYHKGQSKAICIDSSKDLTNLDIIYTDLIKSFLQLWPIWAIKKGFDNTKIKYLVSYGNSYPMSRLCKQETLLLQTVFINMKLYNTCAASKLEDADSSQTPGPISGFQGSMNVHCGTLLFVPQLWRINSFVFYIHQDTGKIVQYMSLKETYNTFQISKYCKLVMPENFPGWLPDKVT